MEAKWSVNKATEDLSKRPADKPTTRETTLMITGNNNTKTFTPTACIVPPGIFTNKSIVTRAKECTVETSVAVNYALRNNLALCKKRTACVRPFS